jgi:hypothetical protein
MPYDVARLYAGYIAVILRHGDLLLLWTSELPQFNSEGESLTVVDGFQRKLDRLA